MRGKELWEWLGCFRNSPSTGKNISFPKWAGFRDSWLGIHPLSDAAVLFTSFNCTPLVVGIEATFWRVALLQLSSGYASSIVWKPRSSSANTFWSGSKLVGSSWIEPQCPVRSSLKGFHSGTLLLSVMKDIKLRHVLWYAQHNTSSIMQGQH